MDWFRINNPLPGVYHIQDGLGVCVTLLAGEKAALLIDTGYGVGSLRALVRSITDKPLTVLLTHAHYDHMYGSYQFDRVLVPQRDLALLDGGGRLGFSKERRKEVWQRALAAGYSGDAREADAYIHTESGNFAPLAQDRFDLGGTIVRVLEAPGHTPGSVCLLAKAQGLLLTGDNWNPTTWVFFKNCLPLLQYAKNMRDLLDKPFAHVLAPHFHNLAPRARLEAFILGLNEETFASAVPRDMRRGADIDIRVCHPEPGTELVFDANRI